jgi:FlaA1/EpsC-like NDP-sugar epimerase
MALRKIIYNYINFISPTIKRKLIIIFDFLLISFCCFIVINPEPYTLIYTIMLSLFLGILLIVLLKLLGAYNVIWRAFGFEDGLRIFGACFSVTLFASIIGNTIQIDINFILLFIFSINLLISSRIFYANWRRFFSFSSSNLKNTVIIGAGQGAARLVSAINSSEKVDFKIVGFVDDDPQKQNFKVSGIPVLGYLEVLPSLIKKLNIQKLIIAIPSATNEEFRRIQKLALSSCQDISYLPSVKKLGFNDINFSDLIELDPKNFLQRNTIYFDKKDLFEELKNKSILITGAGGSIGKELCNQICSYMPKKIILFEQSEPSLFNCEIELKEKFTDIEIFSVIGDIRIIEDISSIIEMHTPEIIFHAAAYKHVPLMEANPGQAVRANILGTMNLARCAKKFNIPKFVLISTDKAVNPTNIMGATKRIAEMICQYISNASPKTKFTVVRFGNVLGSSGSVIPLFKKQIKNGGPITVTHKDIIRYFMSISEACELVLYAATISSGGEIFVLDMGEPVKIDKLARDLISAAGLEVGKDIEIKYTGLRPGEKLYEELLADEEKTIKTSNEKILIAKTRNVTKEDFEKICSLIDNLHLIEKTKIYEKVAQIVKEFKPVFHQI